VRAYGDANRRNRPDSAFIHHAAMSRARHALIIRL
jgi:hypothetical protein